MQLYPPSHFFLFQNQCVLVTPYSFVSFRTRVSQHSRQGSCFICFESDGPLLHDYVQYANSMMLCNVPEEDNIKMHYRAGWHSGNTLDSYPAHISTGTSVDVTDLLLFSSVPTDKYGNSTSTAPCTFLPKPSTRHCTYTVVY